MKLTDSACKNAKPSEKIRKLADGGGLYLEIMPNGKKYWRQKYRFADKEKRLAHGVYPEVTLAEARDKRETARKLLAAGKDPATEKEAQKRENVLNAVNTFEAIGREWHEKHSQKVSKGHADTILFRLEKELFPYIGKRPIREINAPIVLDIIRKIEKRGAHDMALRAKQHCGQILRYAIATGRAERDCTPDLKDALVTVKTTHYASIDPRELPEFLQALEQNKARLYAETRLAMYFMLLTFVRTNELIQASWDEIDLKNKTWLIPPERMKMRQPHLVPLSSQALAILEELKELNGDKGWLFPSPTRHKNHISNNAILSSLRRMGYKGKMTGHGFRSLAMTTIKERLGYRHEVVDRQLAHAHRSKVDAAYDRAKFLDERTKMMQEWADYLDGVGK